MSALSIDVAVKGLRETIRDRRGSVFLIALPVLLVLLFSFTFGSGEFLTGGSLPHEVVVINEDQGVWLSANNTTRYVNYGSNFTHVLENATAQNSTTHLFHFNNASSGRAEDLLKSRSVDAVIIIPKNFSSAFATMVNNSTRTAIALSASQGTITNSNTSTNTASLTPVFNPALGTYVTPTPSVAGPSANAALPTAGNTTTTLVIHGDSAFYNFFTAQSLVTGVLNQYRDTIQQNATASAAPGGDSIFKNYISVQMRSMAGTDSFTYFDGVVPGVIVFTLLLQMSVIASSLVRDIETGMLDRLKLSKIRSFDQLSGTFIVWTLITVGQMILLVGVAVARGYHYQGGIGALGLAVLIGIIAGMASIALALIIASFAKNDTQAMLLGAIIALPLGMMAGAFMPIPRQLLGEFMGRTYTVYEVLPWTWAISALRSVLTYGTGLSADVVFEMAWLVFLTAILFVIGVVVYSRMKLRTAR